MSLEDRPTARLIRVEKRKRRRKSKKWLFLSIASDAHGLSSRPVSVVKGLQRASELLGQVALNRLIEISPKAIINDEPFSLKPLWRN